MKREEMIKVIDAARQRVEDTEQTLLMTMCFLESRADVLASGELFEAMDMLNPNGAEWQRWRKGLDEVYAQLNPGQSSKPAADPDALAQSDVGKRG